MTRKKTRSTVIVSLSHHIDLRFVCKGRGHAWAAHASRPPGRAWTSHASHVRAQLKGKACPVHGSRRYEQCRETARRLYMHRACTNTAERQGVACVACTCITNARSTNTTARQSAAPSPCCHICRFSRTHSVDFITFDSTKQINGLCVLMNHVTNHFFFLPFLPFLPCGPSKASEIVKERVRGCQPG